MVPAAVLHTICSSVNGIVEKFRPLAGEHAQRLLEALDRWLARHDRDVTPSTRGTGRLRAGIGIYYFEEEVTSRVQGGERT